MKEKEKCCKCKSNDWEQEWRGFGIKYICKKCGYMFDWCDYLTAGKINANQITTSKIELKSLVK